MRMVGHQKRMKPQKSMKTWQKNQYPEKWSSGIVNQTIGKNLGDSKKTAKTTAECKSDDIIKQKDIPTLFLQYRGQLSSRLNE